MTPCLVKIWFWEFFVTFDFGESFRHRNIGSLIKVIENDLKNLITQKVNL